MNVGPSIFLLLCAAALEEEEREKKRREERREEERKEKEKEKLRIEEEKRIIESRKKRLSSYDSVIRLSGKEYLVAKKNDKYSFISDNIYSVYNDWFDGYEFINSRFLDTDCILVRKGKKYNLLIEKEFSIGGEWFRLLSERWFDKFVEIRKEFIIVKNGGKYCAIQHNGELMTDVKCNSVEELLEVIDMEYIKIQLLKMKKEGKTKCFFKNAITLGKDGIKVINPLFNSMKLLKHVDFSLVSLKNVNVSGIDFRECDLSNFNPQMVYNRDLRNCNFEGIEFNSNIDFNDVDIRGAKFTWCNIKSLGDAIYDETTLLAGEIPFTDVFGPCQKLEKPIVNKN